MPDRRSALTLVFTQLGDGRVVRDRPAEDLAAANETGIYAPAASPSTPNTRLLDGLAQRRYGYRALGNTYSARAVTGLYNARFSATRAYLMRNEAATTSVASEIAYYAESA